MQKRSFFKLMVLAPIFSGVILSFQNCSPVAFSTNVLPDASSLSGDTQVPPLGLSCNPENRPAEVQNYACLAPNASLNNAVQRYAVVCAANGEWRRTVLGDLDYSACPNTCTTARPSDVENVACPAPNASQIRGVQSYAVSCKADGSWQRTAVGSPDYQLCPQSCDANSKPLSTEAIYCPAPNGTLKAGVQNYSVTCSSNGTWSRSLLAADYTGCPSSCNDATRPSDSDRVKCPTSNANDAIQNYSVTCSSSYQWLRVPTTLNTSACVAPTCNSATRPASQVNVACLAPYAAQNLGVQNRTVTCSGTQWVVTPGSTDYSACPKACTGAAPATRVAIACPSGQTGTAYQNYTVSCNSTTGSWQTVASSADYTGCVASVATCPGGSQSVQSSANNVGAVKTCAFTWSSVTSRAAAYTFTGSSGGTLSAICSSSGAWTNINVNCPAPTDQVVTPNYTYSWDGSSIVNSGSCSAVACGTTGTQNRIYTVCRRSDGVSVSTSYCGSNVAPSVSCSAAACPAAVTCAGGSTSMNSAANNAGTVNTCSFSWPTVTYGSGSQTFYGSNGGVLYGTCGANGAWAGVSATCPAPGNVVVVVSSTPYCDGIGCVGGCGMWERGTLVQYSNGTTQRTNITTGGANDCGGY